MKVVITGVAQGIGLEMAKRYRDRGDEVYGVDVQSVEDSRCSVVDVTDRKALADWAQNTFSGGAPDVWINNAGVVKLSEFHQTDPADIDRVLSVNINGVVNGTSVALGLMQKPARGKICNLASLAGLVPVPFIATYSASKHAVVGFTRSLQLELEQMQSPIQLTLVLPGFVKTSMALSHLPEKARWVVEDAGKVAGEIIEAIEQGKREHVPTVHGKVMSALSRMAPLSLARSSRLLSAKSWKEFLGLKPIRYD